MKHFISTIVLFVLLLLGQAFAAVSQGLPVNSAPRIGVLHPGTATAEANRSNLELFRNSLRVLGYHDGRNIVIEVRSGRGKVDALLRGDDPGVAARRPGHDNDSNDIQE